jgi:hypothetical protein
MNLTYKTCSLNKNLCGDILEHFNNPRSFLSGGLIATEPAKKFFLFRKLFERCLVAFCSNEKHQGLFFVVAALSIDIINPVIFKGIKGMWLCDIVHQANCVSIFVICVRLFFVFVLNITVTDVQHRFICFSLNFGSFKVP